MALQIARTTKHGIEIPTAYVRIVGFSGDLNNMSITTVTHASATARANGDEEVDSGHTVIPSPTTAIPPGGMIQWAYHQIKVLPEFVGHIDV